MIPKRNCIMVICENDILGKISESTYELLGVSSDLALESGSSVAAVSFVPCEKEISELARAGAEKVFFLNSRTSGIFSLEPDAYALSEVIRSIKPDIVLFSATDYGRVLAPKVAANIHCGITADCTDFKINESGHLVQIRPALGGNILAHIVSPSTLPQMATVRPGVFKRRKASGQIAEYIDMSVKIPAERITVVEKKRESLHLNGEKKIEDAKIVVSAGFGVKSEESLEKIRKFAETIGGVCACSRRIVETGLMPHSKQVGQSGKTISPDIYIAIGISGAVQHIAGMKTASKIIAVNSDPDAEIFSVAHIGFVMDAEKWIEKATDFFRKIR
jgi:electron transfer flavoprotein alpha subunit